jgi:hypothetical protein
MKMKSPEAMSRTALTVSQAWKVRSSVGVSGMPKPASGLWRPDLLDADEDDACADQSGEHVGDGGKHGRFPLGEAASRGCFTVDQLKELAAHHATLCSRRGGGGVLAVGRIS